MAISFIGGGYPEKTTDLSQVVSSTPCHERGSNSQLFEMYNNPPISYMDLYRVSYDISVSTRNVLIAFQEFSTSIHGVSSETSWWFLTIMAT